MKAYYCPYCGKYSSTVREVGNEYVVRCNCGVSGPITSKELCLQNYFYCLGIHSSMQEPVEIDSVPPSGTLVYNSMEELHGFGDDFGHLIREIVEYVDVGEDWMSFLEEGKIVVNAEFVKE